nr:MAG TPA: hypothetical protein [Caudoviricetes sp.]
MQVFERELDTPIVITSRFEGGEPLIVSSISSLYSLSVGTRLRVGHENFMKVHRPPPPGGFAGMAFLLNIVKSFSRFSKRQIEVVILRFLDDFLIVPVDCL